MLVHLLPMLQSGAYDSSNDAAAGAVGLVFGLIFFAIYFGAILLLIAGMWKLFVKAGKPGWAAIVPIYNTIVLLEIVGRPVWWIVLLMFPCTAIVCVWIVAIDLAKSFGKTAGYGIGLVLLSPIFMPMLGFGSAKYQGPSVPPAA